MNAETIATINLITAVVLALVTAWYAVSTARMLHQLRQQAAAAVRQADAALKQADAAAQQSRAAEKTLQHVLFLSEQQRGLAHSLVSAAIEESLAVVRRWDGKAVFDLAIRNALPNPRLVPQGADRILEHARLLGLDVAAPLAKAFSQLRLCEDDWLTLGGFGGNSVHAASKPFKRIEAALPDVAKLLTEALNALAQIPTDRSRLSGSGTSLTE